MLVEKVRTHAVRISLRFYECARGCSSLSVLLLRPCKTMQGAPEFYSACSPALVSLLFSSLLRSSHLICTTRNPSSHVIPAAMINLFLPTVRFSACCKIHLCPSTLSTSSVLSPRTLFVHFVQLVSEQQQTNQRLPFPPSYHPSYHHGAMLQKNTSLTESQPRRTALRLRFRLLALLPSQALTSRPDLKFTFATLLRESIWLSKSPQKNCSERRYCVVGYGICHARAAIQSWSTRRSWRVSCSSASLLSQLLWL